MWLKSLVGKRKTGKFFFFVTHYINTINDCREVILAFKGHTMETVESQTILKPFSPEFHFEVQPKYNAKGVHLNGHSFSSLHFLLLLYSSKTEIRFPVNIGITGHVATTGEVIL